MCRKLVVTNRLSLGNRELGWEAYSLPKGEVVEFTSKQLKDIIRGGVDEVYGLELSENGELVFDRDFFTKNMMIKSHINTLVPMEETECITSLFYIIIGERQENGCTVYDAISSRYERAVFTEGKVKLLLEMDIISGGAKLEGDRIVVASMEKGRKEAVKEETKEVETAPEGKGTAEKEPEAVEKKAKSRKKDT